MYFSDSILENAGQVGRILNYRSILLLTLLQRFLHMCAFCNVPSIGIDVASGQNGHQVNLRRHPFPEVDVN